MEQNYQDKIEFVNKLNEAIKFGGMGNIIELHYEVYQSTVNEKWFTEFLYAKYKEGNFQVRTCTGDSNAAILEELVQMLFDSHKFQRESDYYFAIRKRSKRLE
jgi:hypothetical protein